MLVYYLLDVEFLLVREHEVRQRAVGHVLKDFPAFLGSYGNMLIRKLLAMQHLEGFHPQIVSQQLVHGEFAHTCCDFQYSASLARVSLLLFPDVFWELRGADTSFSSAIWSVKGVSSLLGLLHDLPHR